MLGFMSAVAVLLGEPTRAAMLDALMDGGARPAGELARRAGVAPSTASEHLARLVEGRLLVVERQGRERRYRLASADVADVLEALSRLGSDEAPVRSLRARAVPRRCARRAPATTTSPDVSALRSRRRSSCATPCGRTTARSS